MTAEELREQLAKAQETVRSLQEELSETNRGLVALTLELEHRVDARTAELQKLNAELEARVQQRTAQLQEANENLQTFTHSAAHDMRAPLRSIRSLATFALEDHGEKLGSDGVDLLKRIVHAAGQMQRLLNDLLEYSKIAQGELHLQPVALNAAVAEALDLLNSDIRAKNAEVIVHNDLGTVIAHHATLVLLVNNFVTNALKFMPRDRAPRIRIYTEHPPAETFVRLCIEDNGIGIRQEDMEKLFRVFHRLHAESDYPGTGLGLALIKKASERMGGRVGLSSIVGKGSIFWIDLKRHGEN